jgi:PAS domain S-box-containing protein
MTGARKREAFGLRLDVFDPMPVGVAVTSGPEHRLVYTNFAYQQILGVRPLGVPVREAFGDLRQEGYFSRLDQVLRTGAALTLREFPLLLGDSGQRNCSIGMSRIFLESGEEGVLIVLVEITGQVTSSADEFPPEEGRRFFQRYQSLLQVETQAVWVTSPGGHVTEPSPGWQRLTGQSWEEYGGLGWLHVVHPDDRAPLLRAWDECQAHISVLDEVARVRIGHNGYRHVQVRAVPVVDGGEVIEWVGTSSDIEQEWQEERRRTLLDRAAAATADIAGLDEMLTLLSDVIVPTVADGCGLYLLPEFDDQSIPLPIVAERIISFTHNSRLPPEPPPGMERFDQDCAFVEAIRTRRPVHHVFPPGDPPPNAAPTGAEDWFVAGQVNSMAIIPVIVDGTVAAVLDAVVCGSREPISPCDIDLLSRMLAHAHAHLSNAMRFQRTQRVALALQNCLLPDPPEVTGLEIVARYRPSARAVEIGGDWYDSFLLPDGATILTIGDVAGHDLTAAVTMSQLRNMLRGLAMDRREPPGDILRRLDFATESLYPDGTATCILARLEGSAERGHRRLDYSVAGHPPPLLITHEGEASFLPDDGDPLLGIVCDRPRSSVVAHLPPRSTLLLYTDGLIELPGEHLDRGLERLRWNAASLAGAPLDVFCDRLLARMPTARKDDIAVIAVRLP